MYLIVTIKKGDYLKVRIIAVHQRRYSRSARSKSAHYEQCLRNPMSTAVFGIIGNSPLIESCDSKSQCKHLLTAYDRADHRRKRIGRKVFPEDHPFFELHETWEFIAIIVELFQERHNRLRAFGHEKGSFTGHMKPVKDIFEVTDGAPSFWMKSAKPSWHSSSSTTKYWKNGEFNQK